MHEIGQIALTQVQRSVLVVENGSESYYDPTPLVVVEYLLLSPQGVSGITAGGSQVMDIHHEHHPNSHNHKGMNGLSFGFIRQCATSWASTWWMVSQARILWSRAKHLIP